MGAIEENTFEHLHPGRYITFHFPNPLLPQHEMLIAVLDTPLPGTTAAMIVPKGRQTDWTFTTQAGHSQLAFSAQASRLILITLIGEHDITQLQQKLTPLLMALSPRAAFADGLPSVPFVSYTDNVITQLTLQQLATHLSGMMLVEDVELGFEKNLELCKEWRRRLRFQRMPNLVQTQIPLSKNPNSRNGSEAELDLSKLVHPYLPPMVAGLAFLGDECLGKGVTNPKLISVGVGGGALLMFLKTHFQFSILGIEIDDVIIGVATKYFGLEEDKHLKIRIGDGIQAVQEIAYKAIACGLVKSHLVSSSQDEVNNLRDPSAISDVLVNVIDNVNLPVRGSDDDVLDNETINGVCDYVSCLSEEENMPPLQSHIGEKGVEDFASTDDPRVHAIVVDVDAGDASTGLCAPPREFLEKRFILASGIALLDAGVLIMNVVPPNKAFYDDLVRAFGEYFLDLYEIVVNDGENYVFIACPSKRDCAFSSGTFLDKVRNVIQDDYIDQIKRIVV